MACFLRSQFVSCDQFACYWDEYLSVVVNALTDVMLDIVILVRRPQTLNGCNIFLCQLRYPSIQTIDHVSLSNTAHPDTKLIGHMSFFECSLAGAVG